MLYSEWFDQLLMWLDYLAGVLPPSLFVVIGSALEEIIAIIPSSVVLVAAGTVAAAHGDSLVQIFWMSFLGGLTKTVFSYGFYLLADVIEDKIPPRFLRMLGYKQGEAEEYGARMSKGWKDAAVLLALRTIPLVPSLPVSLICGFLKTDVRTFLWTSLVGFTIKTAAFILVGYYGLEIFQGFV